MLYQQVIARRYARGLKLSMKAEELDDIEEQFNDLIGVLEESGSDLASLFRDPAFFPAEKRSVIEQICERYKFNPVLKHFLFVLLEKGRLSLLALIHKEFVALLDEHHGRLRAHIKTAEPIDEDMVADIKAVLKKICKKEILADVEIDKGLLAGTRVEIGGMVIDGSAKAKLIAMKNRLVNSIETASV